MYINKELYDTKHIPSIACMKKTLIYACYSRYMLEEDKYTQLAVSIYAFSFNGEGFAVGIKAGGRK